MACPRPAPASKRQTRPALELADIFRQHGEAYRRAHALSLTQRKAFDAIVACRTEVLGGHLDVCDHCGFAVPSYNSCRNRHCPKCQSLAQARWIEARKQRLLDTHYFHVVFTLPAQLRPLARQNPERIYDLLFASVSQTLLELGQNEKRLGATLGVTAVLHTWTRELSFHPHLHCIVTGGGLSPDGSRWIAARSKYLFPVRVLGRLFRGKFLAGLRKLYDQGGLVLERALATLAEPSAFGRLVDELYGIEWVVYAKRPFGGAQQVFDYLGRYTHRVGLSNQRLQSVDEHGVTFVTKGDRTITLEPQEFIRRFLEHILPPRFVKIRHYGLWAASNISTRLAKARVLLPVEIAAAAAPSCAFLDAPDWQNRLLALTGIDLSLCPRCQAGRMLRQPLTHPDTS
jgi:Putative transposase/Transposase zinc-binding domain